MMVAINHQISDSQTFWKGVKDVLGQLPAGLEVQSVFKSKDGSKAVCLWKCDSLANLRSFIDQRTTGIARNEYFEIDEINSMGLPGSKKAA